jgi:hypothetical protein
MSSALPYALIAELVLALHAALVVFVVGGVPLIVAGNLRRWRWVNGMALRLLHLAAIVVVAAQAWLSVDCPLTTLEMWLRAQAGLPTYPQTFVGHWLQRLLYFDAPAWAFMLVYTLFGLVVAGVWVRFPPRKQ